jgi:hypothetical protein
MRGGRRKYGKPLGMYRVPWCHHGSSLAVFVFPDHV